MKVERERFLFLAAALSACGGSDAPPPQAAVVPVPTPPSAAPAVTAAPTAPPPANTAPPPVAQPIAPNPYDGTPVKAQSCDVALNRMGKPAVCKVVAPPGPSCESLRDTKKECPHLNDLLKPRVAEAAIDCINRKSGSKDICEFNISSICAYQALAVACLDPTAKSVCDGVIQKCGNTGPMTQESCEAGVSGVVDAKRKKFVTCITEACRFENCLSYLLAPP